MIHFDPEIRAFLASARKLLRRQKLFLRIGNQAMMFDKVRRDLGGLLEKEMDSDTDVEAVTSCSERLQIYLSFLMGACTVALSRHRLRAHHAASVLAAMFYCRQNFSADDSRWLARAAALTAVRPQLMSGREAGEIAMQEYLRDPIKPGWRLISQVNRIILEV